MVKECSLPLRLSGMVTTFLEWQEIQIGLGGNAYFPQALQRTPNMWAAFSFPSGNSKSPSLKGIDFFSVISHLLSVSCLSNLTFGSESRAMHRLQTQTFVENHDGGFYAKASIPVTSLATMSFRIWVVPSGMAILHRVDASGLIRGHFLVHNETAQPIYSFARLSAGKHEGHSLKESASLTIP